MRRIRVLVVEDSIVMRRAITTVLGKDSGLEVVGAAVNGRVGLELVAQLKPDLVTLDIEMPELDGLAVLREIRKVDRHIPVVMFSSLTQRGARATILALPLGATDYVGKPTNVSSLEEAWRCLESELLPKVRLHGERALQRTAGTSSTSLSGAPASTPARPSPAVPGSPRPLARPPVTVVCIGVSTGGPNALAQILGAMTEPPPVPILIVQHMPAAFTRLLAERLSGVAPFDVTEAEPGQLVAAGRAYVAAGGRHLLVRPDHGGVCLQLNDEPPENSCRPAVDVLLRSAAAVYGNGVLALILTGMGKDGVRGCEAVRAQGGAVFAQDEASSVVWGMPGAVVAANLVDAVWPLDQVAVELARVTRFRPSRPVGGAAGEIGK